MSKDFKFVCREAELESALFHIERHPVVVLTGHDKSGMSHFLKRLWLDTGRESNYSFIISGNHSHGVAQQFVTQIFGQMQNHELKDIISKQQKSRIISEIVKSSLYSIDAVPALPSLGSVAVSLIEGIGSTLDVDISHVGDYKLEKALDTVFNSIAKTIRSFTIIVDNSNNIGLPDLEYLLRVAYQYNARILFANASMSAEYKAEFISKLFSCTHCQDVYIKVMPAEFMRPDDTLIRSLFECYGKQYNQRYLQFFDKHNRNIHVIMAYINGYQMDAKTINDDALYVLKILTVATIPLSLEVLSDTFAKKEVKARYIDLTDVCNDLTKYHLVTSEMGGSISLNKGMVDTGSVKITHVEKLIITRDIVDAITNRRDLATIPMLEYAVLNLERDYSRRKDILLLLINRQHLQNSINPTHLDMLFSFDNKLELLYACRLYYELQIYDAPYHRLSLYSQYAGEFDYDLLYAMTLERLHMPAHVELLENLFINASSMDNQCLVLTVLFVAYLNSDISEKYKMIATDKESVFYHANFYKSKYYPYLLRNVAYYQDDPHTGLKCYRQVLSYFRNHDTVNYNRTISNFLCFLMKHEQDGIICIELKNTVAEVCRILEYNDQKYVYLNINYGLYLAKYTDEDPSKYFLSIPYSAGTTETPYIYSQINLAVYYANENPRLALQILDGVESFVDKTTVPKTRQFYIINRCFVEYANGEINSELVSMIRNNPIRGNVTEAERIYEEYLHRKRKEIVCQKEARNALALEGYIFYRYFDPGLFLSNPF